MGWKNILCYKKYTKKNNLHFFDIIRVWTIEFSNVYRRVKWAIRWDLTRVLLKQSLWKKLFEWWVAIYKICELKNILGYKKYSKKNNLHFFDIIRVCTIPDQPVFKFSFMIYLRCVIVGVALTYRGNRATQVSTGYVQ